ncbi:MAG TPA: sensor histidine kinase [Thermomicrobiales bacterium]|nr:sensor histidine kinase [Thermomicrobiales bacterium]
MRAVVAAHHVRARHLNRLKWIGAIIPAVAIYLAETIRHDWIEPYLPANVVGNLVVGAIAFSCSFAFSAFIFQIIDRMQAELLRRNAELAAVNEYATEAVSMHDVPSIVRRTRALLAALFPSAVVTISLLGPHVAADERDAPDRNQPASPEASPRPETSGHRFEASLQSHRGFIGSITIVQPDRGLDTAEQRLLCLVADTSTMAIENALLLGELRSIAIADERHWLAREMHDGLGQLLASMLVQIDIIEALTRDQQHSRTLDALGALRDTAERANAEIRAEIASLRLLADLDRDFFERLDTFVGDFEDQTGIATDLVVDRAPGASLSPEVGLQLIRIIQESLANIRKHSGATLVIVRLAVGEEAVSLEIHDNGRGFDALAPANGATTPRFGLMTMRERAESLDGELQIESARDAGTRLRARIPRQRNGALAYVTAAGHDRGRSRAVS